MARTVKNLMLNLKMQKILECWFIELDFLDIKEQCNRILLSANVLCQILIYGETNNKILNCTVILSIFQDTSFKQPSQSSPNSGHHLSLYTVYHFIEDQQLLICKPKYYKFCW